MNIKKEVIESISDMLNKKIRDCQDQLSYGKREINALAKKQRLRKAEIGQLLTLKHMMQGKIK